MPSSTAPAKDRALLGQSAREALSKAYAPYSQVRVGAAVLTERGNTFAAGNVENASYGLSLCAERAAIARAVTAEGPAMRIRAIAVVSDRPGLFAPCGACRQVIFEFGPGALVMFQGEKGLLEIPITALLPHAFHLDKF